MDMPVYDRRGGRTTCLAREVLVSFDVQKQVGWPYRTRAAGKPPDLVEEFGSASTAKGVPGRRGSGAKVGRVGILAVRPPRGA